MGDGGGKGVGDGGEKGVGDGGGRGVGDGGVVDGWDGGTKVEKYRVRTDNETEVLCGDGGVNDGVNGEVDDGVADGEIGHGGVADGEGNPEMVRCNGDGLESVVVYGKLSSSSASP